MKNKQRLCGMLMHPTSFNSPYGIGDLGQEARDTLKLVSSAGIRLWQILPLGPTGYGDSPYSARSTFAGNELLIDLRSIEGVDSYPDTCADCTARVDYPAVYASKMVYLKDAAQKYYAGHYDDEEFISFCAENSWWLDDYALYQSLVSYFNDSRWFLWQDDIKNRQPQALYFWSQKLHSSIIIFKTLQFLFFKQWNSLHKFALSLGMKIIGDIPFFVAADSVDAWSNPKLFKMDENGNQLMQAGVPPDAFSSTGQLWGNPVYDWSYHSRTDYSWWRKRLEMTLKTVDVVRIDHFRGFEACWETPMGEITAEGGSWVKGPGQELLNYFKDYPIIAEDLGVITEQVEKLRLDNNFPGMKILHFAFDLTQDGLNNKNWYLPFNYEKNCVAYTGTHDNQTSRGWFNSLSEDYKDIVRRYLQSPNEDVVWQMLRSLLSSSADTVIFPMQDIIGLDDEARMNKPSTVGSSNWSWRFNPSQLQTWMLDRLREYIKLYGRFI